MALVLHSNSALSDDSVSSVHVWDTDVTCSDEFRAEMTEAFCRRDREDVSAPEDEHDLPEEMTDDVNVFQQEINLYQMEGNVIL